MYGNSSYGSEGESIMSAQKGKQPMPTNNNGSPYDIFLRLMQPAIIIALAVVGWGLSDIKDSIKTNADILRRVEGTQIRVTETIRRLEEDLRNHEISATNESARRSAFHHTEIRSCLQCKARPDYHPPMQSYTPPASPVK